MSIQFKTLSLQDALDLAILIEEEACERYQEFSKYITNLFFEKNAFAKANKFIFDMKLF